MKQLIRTFFSDRHGRVVLWQRPNVPLVGWLVFLVLAKIVQHGAWHTVMTGLSQLSLVIWAVLEIGWGASYFRRTLGLVVLVFTLVARFWS